MTKKLTIQDLYDGKGKKQFTETYTHCPLEARAAEEAGIDIIVTCMRFAPVVREAAPNTLMTVGMGIHDPNMCNATEAIRESFKAMQLGADMIYCGMSVDTVGEMAREHIPVIGHVGYVPYRASWFGGARAVGKHADEAISVYERTKAFEDAGAVGVEMEIVPEAVATEISKRTRLIVISMGSGTGCDAQYLFAEDILGTNTGHVPRHAKQYGKLHAELERVQALRVEAFKGFCDEVESGAYPEPGHNLKIKPEEFDAFMARLNG